MATLIRRHTTVYIDANGKRVPKGTEGARKVRKKVARWYGQYVDANGQRHRVPLSANREAAKTMLANLIKKNELEKAGVVVPYAESRKKPLSEHLDDMEASMRALGTSERQISQKTGRIRRMLDACSFVFIQDIEATRAQSYLADLAERGFSATTRNHHMREARSFCTWLVKNRRTDHNPLAHLQATNTRNDRRHDRRPLSAKELQAIIVAARVSQRVFRGIAGADRGMLYWLASSSGFRVSELASLTPSSFDLDSSPPVVNLAAGNSKNGKGATQPIPSDLARELRGYLSTKPIGEPVWPGRWQNDGAAMFRIDLEAAGISYVVEGPNGPLYADFHSLRHSFIAMLDKSGATLKEAMQLARHSDPRLTMATYGRAQLHDLGEAVGRLPSFTSPAAPEAAVLRATGTEDGRNALAPALAPKGDISRDLVRQADTESGVAGKGPSSIEPQENPCFLGFPANSGGYVQTGPDRLR
jgi:integrase